MLTPQVVASIDSLRRRGLSYDEVVTRLERTGVPAPQVEPLLQRYGQVRDAQGRPREQVNLGDPAERRR